MIILIILLKFCFSLHPGFLPVNSKVSILSRFNPSQRADHSYTAIIPILANCTYSSCWCRVAPRWWPMFLGQCLTDYTACCVPVILHGVYLSRVVVRSHVMLSRVQSRVVVVVT